MAKAQAFPPDQMDKLLHYLSKLIADENLADRWHETRFGRRYLVLKVNESDLNKLDIEVNEYSSIFKVYNAAKEIYGRYWKVRVGEFGESKQDGYCLDLKFFPKK